MDTILFYIGITWDYVLQMLPCCLGAGAAFFLIRAPRRRRLAAAGLESGPLREGALLLFLLFCAGLGALTLFQSGFWSWGHWRRVAQGAAPVFYPVDYAQQLRNAQLIPLQNILNGGGSGRWARYMLWGNTLMFMPLGFFPAALWRKSRWWKGLLAGGGASLLIETVQFFIGRSTDINDVLLNALGGLCGFWCFLLLRRLAPRWMKRLQCMETEGDSYGRQTDYRRAPARAGKGEL